MKAMFCSWQSCPTDNAKGLSSNTYASVLPKTPLVSARLLLHAFVPPAVEKEIGADAAPVTAFSNDLGIPCSAKARGEDTVLPAPESPMASTVYVVVGTLLGKPRPDVVRAGSAVLDVALRDCVGLTAGSASLGTASVLLITVRQGKASRTRRSRMPRFGGKTLVAELVAGVEGVVAVGHASLCVASRDLGVVPAIPLSAGMVLFCLLYTSPSPRDRTRSRMPSSA